jgi:N-acetylglucosaminyldiphosphoundecaprenol N-acetyl-beta-D-mannosaminyltransferase
MKEHKKSYECKNRLTRHVLGSITFRTAGLNNLENHIKSWLQSSSRQSRLIGYINPHVYNYACNNTVVNDFLRHSDFVCVDGVGIKLLALMAYGLQLKRVVATHLFEEIIDSTGIDVRAILIGTTQEEVDAAMVAINNRSHGLHIVAAYHGFHPIDTYIQILHKHTQIDAILVGMGTPKSEQFLLQAHQICKSTLCWHIGGGTIRIYAGTKLRAPVWLSNIGCEWLHRIVFEPELRSRYLSGGIKFTCNIVTNLITTTERSIKDEHTDRKPRL